MSKLLTTTTHKPRSSDEGNESTKVQTLGAYHSCISWVLCQCVCAENWPRLARVVAVRVRVVLSVLAPTWASNFWARLNVVDTRCVTSGASLCFEQERETAGKPVNLCFVA